jgi:catechol 2,3-dioxygenase-like lactoylglutathione lyase family enzyme
VAKIFYAETLGFTVVRDTVEGEQRWVELGPTDTGPTVTLVTWFPQMPAGSLQGLVLDTDDIAQACEELRARGVELSPIESDQWGQFARFNDPDGNGLVFRQRSPAA